MSAETCVSTTPSVALTFSPWTTPPVLEVLDGRLAVRLDLDRRGLDQLRVIVREADKYLRRREAE